MICNSEANESILTVEGVTAGKMPLPLLLGTVGATVERNSSHALHVTAQAARTYQRNAHKVNKNATFTQSKRQYSAVARRWQSGRRLIHCTLPPTVNGVAVLLPKPSEPQKLHVTGQLSAMNCAAVVHLGTFLRSACKYKHQPI